MEKDWLQELWQTGRVRDLAQRDRHCREALEKLGIDTCCGGGHMLAEAARERGVSLRALQQALAAPSEPVPTLFHADWRRASSELLVEYILEMHHAMLREELPHLGVLFARVRVAHPDHAAELKALHEEYAALYAELLPHLDLEEQKLFPALRRGEIPSDAEVIIRQLETEHTGAGERLRRMHESTGGYRIPAYACPTVELLFQGLARLEAGLHEHINLENNVLFLRALPQS